MSNTLISNLGFRADTQFNNGEYSKHFSMIVYNIIFAIWDINRRNNEEVRFLERRIRME